MHELVVGDNTAIGVDLFRISATLLRYETSDHKTVSTTASPRPWDLPDPRAARSVCVGTCLRCLVSQRLCCRRDRDIRGDVLRDERELWYCAGALVDRR